MKRSEKAKAGPKFRVGQVVRMWRYGYYLRVTFSYQVAEGVGRGLRWWYKLAHYNQMDTIDNIRETDLRPLTVREAGPARGRKRK
jgi:hypothetical protein